MKIYRYLSLSVLLWLNGQVLAETVAVSTATDASQTEQILRVADRSRGGGLPGLVWQINVDSVLKNKQEHFQLAVKVAGDDWLAEFKAPNNVRGNKLLQKKTNMWFSKQGLRKPVPISLRQRLTGSASNGDIASTNYVQDYDAIRLEDEEYEGAAVFVFELTAKSDDVTYDRIRYRVAQQTGLGIQAQFYTKAGKLLKTATFKYDNQLTNAGVTFPFISQMVIEDELTKGQRSVLNYSDISLQTISPTHFRL
jgi:hypothetical protein